MAATITSSPGDFIEQNLFIESRVEPDAKVKHHLELIAVPHNVLMQSVSGRNRAANARLKADGMASYCRDQMLDALAPLALHTAAHFGATTHPGYQRIFVRTVAQFTSLPLRDLPNAMVDLDKALRDDATPAEIKKHAQAFLAARAAWSMATVALQDATEALKKAGDAVDAAKQGCLVAYARLRARLSDQFPRQPRIVARYFPPTKVRSRTPAEGVAPPVEPLRERAEEKVVEPV